VSRASQLEAEHRAGKEATNRHILDEVARVLLEKHERALRRKFKHVVSTMLDKDGDIWRVVVTVLANDSNCYPLACDLLGFPSDELIAQLMLLDQ